ncbi:CepA family extended-spectrum class A beta-lactamase [Rurimicrobium arvi]|uniref:beta-lactamase n=2 Tax=Rurimicrobium arvi TaxID=2049916 RepID=A0ABP8MH39_9BACT
MTVLVKAIDSIGSNMKLALYATELETGESISVNGDTAMPMQSTFKFPLALAVLHQCEVQNIRLDTSIQIYATDLIENTWSPMRDSLGTKSFRLPLKDLLYFVTACSDNIACDVLFRFCGGPDQVDSFIAEKGFPDIEIRNTEAELHEVWQRQYKNSTSPHAMSELLLAFYKNKVVNKEHTDYLLDLMLHNKTGDARIRAGVPEGTPVADKTGTCYPDNGPGTVNDIAIVTLPNGNHLALSVYITDAHVDVDHGQAAIANATRLVYRYFAGK